MCIQWQIGDGGQCTLQQVGAVEMGNICGKSEAQPEPLPLSIGKNYKELILLFSGEGIKRTPSWEAEITRQELAVERQRFWATRSSGSRRIWLLLKEAVEADHLSAAMLLQMGSIGVQSGCMTSCKDAEDNLYEIPLFVLNDPRRFSEDQVVPQRKAQKPTEIKSITVKLRSMTTQHDRTITLSNSSTIRELKALLVQQESDEDFAMCRLFFSGKEAKEDDTLLSCGLKQGMVLQLLEAKKD